MPSRDRPLDVVVFGATGFTGQLVAAHLAATGQRRWGIAGRSYDALRRVRADLTSLDPGAADVEILVARAEDPDALAAMAERARVVIAAAGPYTRIGEPLVAACVRAGTHYVDVADEPTFFATVVSRYHDEAARRGVVVVPCCGFEAVPADLGLQYLLEQLPSRGDVDVDVEAFVSSEGDWSGGSWQAALGSAANGMPGSVLRLRPRADRGRGPHFSRRTGRWAIPSSSIDPLVVRRSAELAPADAVIKRVCYHEYRQARSLPAAGATLLAAGSTAVLSRLSPARRLMARVAPPGTGPSPEQRARGWFRVRLIGRAGACQVTVEIRGGEPMYDETAKMAAEGARALLDATNTGARPQGGVRTPATAMGPALRERLESAGVTFRVVAREQT